MKTAYTLIFAALFLFSLQAMAVHALSYSDVEVVSARYDPYPAQPGGYVTVYVDLYNLGTSDANNVVFTLLPQYPFSLDPGANTTFTFDALRAGGSALIQYNVRVAPDAVDGTTKLNYILAYDSFRNTGKFVSIQIAQKNNLAITSVTPTLLKPGEPATMVFTVQNLGNSTTQGINIGWDEANRLIVPIGAGNRQYIDSLTSQEAQNVSFDVIADPTTAPGAYTLNVTLSYNTQNSTASLATKVGIIVGGQADLDTAIQGYSSGVLSLAIANIGSNPASAVSVTIPQQPGFRLTGPGTQFLGNLQKGDYTLASFQVASAMQAAAAAASGGPVDSGFPQGQAPGQAAQGQAVTGQENSTRRRAGFGNFTTSALAVQVWYTDTLGRRQVIERTLSFDPASFSASGTTTAFGAAGRTQQQTNIPGIPNLPWFGYLISGVVLALLGLFAYGRFIKKKKPIAPKENK